MTLVLGIDPGAIAGLMLVNTVTHQVVHRETVRTRANSTAPEKGHVIAQAALRIITRHHCWCVALEAQFSPHIGQATGQDLKRIEATASAAQKVSFLAGCISGAITTVYPWVSVVQVQPSTAASAIGVKGKRNKDAVRAQAKLVLRIRDKLPEEQADAAACCYGYDRASAHETIRAGA